MKTKTSSSKAARRNEMGIPILTPIGYRTISRFSTNRAPEDVFKKNSVNRRILSRDVPSSGKPERSSLTSLDLWMNLALKEARKAAGEGEVPIGAVIVRDGLVIARGHNRPIRANDPTAHSEVVAIRKAARKLGNYRLTGCELYVTVEPCAMCLGAVLQARIGRLVYGALDSKAGAVKSIVRFPIHKTNHKLEIHGGVLAEECAAVLRDFFRERRNRRRSAVADQP